MQLNVAVWKIMIQVLWRQPLTYNPKLVSLVVVGPWNSQQVCQKRFSFIVQMYKSQRNKKKSLLDINLLFLSKLLGPSKQERI